jgi:mono/diheme cytochrome c family protein
MVWLAAVTTMSAMTVGQDVPTPASAGVYTTEQADRGKQIFASLCTGCHTVASQSGDSFSKKWKGAVMADLNRVLVEEMPKDDPGSLTATDRTDLMAYLLKINGLNAGTTPLGADEEQLKKIVIDLK